MSEKTIDTLKTSMTEIAGGTSPAKVISRDQLLTDIRSGRRLERVVDSVKLFLEMQVDKIEQTLGQCEAAVENERQLQKRLAEFEKEKHQWNQTRMSEIERLSAAGDELSKAWAQLEVERRQFLDSKTKK